MKRICELTREYRVSAAFRAELTVAALDATDAADRYIAALNPTPDSFWRDIGKVFEFKVVVVSTGETLEVERRILKR